MTNVTNSDIIIIENYFKGEYIMNAQTICLMNNKGGVGKSTSSGAFAGVLASLDKKVLIVDCDPQGNSSQLFQSYRTTSYTIIDVFTTESQNVTKETIQNFIYHTNVENVDIIAANEDFTFTSDDITRDNTRIQQLILKKALSTVKDLYDYILIDNSPCFNIISINALCAADYVISPVEADGFSYLGLVQLLKKINSIKSELNEDLKILGVYMTKLAVTTNVARDLYYSFKSEIGDSFIPVYIRQDNQVRESNTAFVPLIKYSPKSNAIKDYKKLIADLHILDETSQKKLVKEVKEFYKQEIDSNMAKKETSENDIIDFQIEVLKNNLARL